MQTLLPGIVGFYDLWPERHFVDMPQVARLALLGALRSPVPRPSAPEPLGRDIYFEALRTWERGGARINWNLVQDLQGLRARAVYELSFDDILIREDDHTFFGIVAREPFWRWNHYPFAQSVFYGLLQLTPNIYMRHPENLFRRLNKLALRLAEDAGLTMSTVSMFHMNLALYERLCGLEYDRIQRTENFIRNILDNQAIEPLDDRRDRAECFAVMHAYLKQHLEAILELGVRGRPFNNDIE